MRRGNNATERTGRGSLQSEGRQICGRSSPDSRIVEGWGIEDKLSGESEMKTDNPVPLAQRWTAVELRKLSPEQRDAIMEAAAALAEEEYHINAELTAFEAFGKDDLHGDSSSAETR